jgi:hypothetical protein
MAMPAQQGWSQQIELLRSGSKIRQQTAEIPHAAYIIAKAVPCAEHGQGNWWARELLMGWTGARMTVLLLLHRHRAGVHAQAWVAWLERAGATVTALAIDHRGATPDAITNNPLSNPAVIILTRGVPRSLLDACLAAASPAPAVFRLGPRPCPPWRLLDEHAHMAAPALDLRLMLVAAGLTPIAEPATRRE